MNKNYYYYPSVCIYMETRQNNSVLPALECSLCFLFYFTYFFVSVWMTSETVCECTDSTLEVPGTLLSGL